MVKIDSNDQKEDLGNPSVPEVVCWVFDLMLNGKVFMQLYFFQGAGRHFDSIGNRGAARSFFSLSSGELKNLLCVRW